MNTTTATKALSRAPQTLIKPHHTPFRIPQLQQPRTLHTIGLRKPFPPSTTPTPAPTHRITAQIRSYSTGERPLTDRPPSPQSQQAADIAARKSDQPSYHLTFTCKACSERSTHHVTHQAYHHGTTLITCPGCKNRHLISDHLKIFSDEGVTLEEIVREKGELLRKGRVGEDGDVEFYNDDEGTVGGEEKKKVG